jgi:hypothetical protein
MRHGPRVLAVALCLLSLLYISHGQPQTRPEACVTAWGEKDSSSLAAAASPAGKNAVSCAAPGVTNQQPVGPGGCHTTVGVPTAMTGHPVEGTWIVRFLDYKAADLQR